MVLDDLDMLPQGFAVIVGSDELFLTLLQSGIQGCVWPGNGHARDARARVHRVHQRRALEGPGIAEVAFCPSRACLEAAGISTC